MLYSFTDKDSIATCSSSNSGKQTSLTICIQYIMECFHKVYLSKVHLKKFGYSFNDRLLCILPFIIISFIKDSFSIAPLLQTIRQLWREYVVAAHTWWKRHTWVWLTGCDRYKAIQVETVGSVKGTICLIIYEIVACTYQGEMPPWDPYTYHHYIAYPLSYFQIPCCIML